jgi:hypothetical protein
VRVMDGVAYLARGRDGLRTVDVSNPAAPLDVGGFQPSDDFYNDVKVLAHDNGHRYALMAGFNGLVVLDVTDPSAVLPAGQHTGTLGGAHSVFLETVDGTPLAYVVDGGQVLEVVDLTRPEAPQMLARQVGRSYHDIFAEERRVYINGSPGLQIIDVGLEGDVTEVGQYDWHDTIGDDIQQYPYSHSNWVTTIAGRRVSVLAAEGYGSYLIVVDVEPTSATFLARLGEYHPRPEISLHNLIALGTRVYVAHYQAGLRVLEISDPGAIHELAYFNTFDEACGGGTFYEGAFGVDVDPAARLVYVADTRGLIILREAF